MTNRSEGGKRKGLAPRQKEKAPGRKNSTQVEGTARTGRKREQGRGALSKEKEDRRKRRRRRLHYPCVQ